MMHKTQAALKQYTHSTQGFWSSIPGQATNKKLSVDRICTGNTFNFFCNWRILGPSSSHNMQTNTHAKVNHTAYTQDSTHMAPFSHDTSTTRSSQSMNWVLSHSRMFYKETYTHINKQCTLLYIALSFCLLASISYNQKRIGITLAVYI